MGDFIDFKDHEDLHETCDVVDRIGQRTILHRPVIQVKIGFALGGEIAAQNIFKRIARQHFIGGLAIGRRKVDEGCRFVKIECFFHGSSSC